MRKYIAIIICLTLITSLSAVAEDKIEVVSVTRYRMDSSLEKYEKRYRVIGEIVNNTEKNLDVRVGITWITDDGDVAGTGRDSKAVLLRPIRPDEKLPFFAQMLEDDLQIREIKVNIKSSQAYKKGPRRFKVTRSKKVKPDKVTGFIKNVSNERKELLAIGVFYDKKGDVVDVSQVTTPIAFPEVDPGEEVGFEVYISRKEDEVEDFRIIPTVWG